MEKICTICKELKSDFYKDKYKKSGYASRCKNCERLMKRIQRKKFPDVYKRKDDKWHEANKEKLKKWRAEYYKNNKHKIQAHYQVKQALYKGILKKIHNCEQCGALKTYAHHPDYSKPLDVVWLCGSCHMRWHADND